MINLMSYLYLQARLRSLCYVVLSILALLDTICLHVKLRHNKTIVIMGTKRIFYTQYLQQNWFLFLIIIKDKYYLNIIYHHCMMISVHLKEFLQPDYTTTTKITCIHNRRDPMKLLLDGWYRIGGDRKDLLSLW